MEEFPIFNFPISNLKSNGKSKTKLAADFRGKAQIKPFGHEITRMRTNSKSRMQEPAYATCAGHWSLKLEIENWKLKRSSRFQATISFVATSKNMHHQPDQRFNSMISKCANPECSKLLMRLDGGRFFGFPTSKSNIEHFWLCISCSKHFTLKHQGDKVELVMRARKSA